MLTVLILLSLLKSYSASDKPSDYETIPSIKGGYGPIIPEHDQGGYGSMKTDYGIFGDPHAVFTGKMPLNGFPVEKFVIASSQICKDKRGICKSPCQEGFTSFNNMCYKYIHRRLCFHDAEMHCRNNYPGGHLASVHCNLNHQLLRDLAKDAYYTHPMTWIGLTDCSKECHFLWTDGTVSDHTEWCPGEPSDQVGKENCVAMNHKLQYLWTDEECKNEFNFICAYRLGCPGEGCNQL
ncbi:lectin-like [Callorhinchus milii]|uniref:Lectin-like n=1 Tax=Callorhinchus milii TaxID=7868 RepID=A0A4W3GI86_CALMI|nr:lectin-like [Callorhinchus milii]|eukprot:gi/632961555/ref/XP_007896819.1/ PREDICTED: lectin-like [Callorhinchus milii]